MKAQIPRQEKAARTINDCDGITPWDKTRKVGGLLPEVYSVLYGCCDNCIFSLYALYTAALYC